MTSCFVNRLVLELYRRGFEDKDGDLSDQPVTALTACEGSFSFVLVDKERDAILVARSGESDTHPLFWGTGEFIVILALAITCRLTSCFVHSRGGFARRVDDARARGYDRG